MQPRSVTLTEFLIAERRRYPQATGELNGLILSVALACKAIANQVSQGALAGVLGAAGEVNVQGEAQQRLDVVANAAFLDCVAARSSVAECKATVFNGSHAFTAWSSRLTRCQPTGPAKTARSSAKSSVRSGR